MALNLILDRVAGTCTTTDGTTWVSVLTHTPPVNSVSRFECFIVGKDASNNAVSFAVVGCITRTVGDLTLIGTGSGGSNFSSAAISLSADRVQVTTSVLEIQVKGVAATTIEWFCEAQLRVA